MSKLRAIKCNHCSKIVMSSTSLCRRCEAIKEQELGIGFYDLLRKTNPSLYWEGERGKSARKIREENPVGVAIPIFIVIAILYAVVSSWRG